VQTSVFNEYIHQNFNAKLDSECVQQLKNLLIYFGGVHIAKNDQSLVQRYFSSKKHSVTRLTNL